MTTSPSDRLAEARARFERTTHPEWRDSTDMGVVLAEVDALRGQLGGWIAAVGQAKDDAARALGLLERGDTGQLGSLLQRMAGGERELPQRESLQAENERLRGELAELRACDCYPNPNDHADRCPVFLAAQPPGEDW